MPEWNDTVWLWNCSSLDWKTIDSSNPRMGLVSFSLFYWADFSFFPVGHPSFRSGFYLNLSWRLAAFCLVGWKAEHTQDACPLDSALYPVQTYVPKWNRKNTERMSYLGRIEGDGVPLCHSMHPQHDGLVGLPITWVGARRECGSHSAPRGASLFPYSIPSAISESRSQSPADSAAVDDSSYRKLHFFQLADNHTMSNPIGR